MTAIEMPGITGRVGNQAPPLPELNLYDTDVALQECLRRYAPDWDPEQVRTLGETAGSEEAREHARRAERNTPRLYTHDRFGHRVDEVECDPSYHWLTAVGVEHGITSLPWVQHRPGAHVVRAGLGYLLGQVNTGVMCPLIMTFAAVPVLLAHAPRLAEQWVARLASTDYATGALAGQMFTETQGGSDLRATQTRAMPAGDGSYELWGHKWFVSGPMCEVFLALAQTDAGLTCFMVQRGEGFRIVRLKDKLGTRSLPTAEVDLHGLRGWMVGAEGDGMAALVRSVSYTRIGPAVSPEMRAAVVRAIQHARHRAAFGVKLVDQPLMANVLADLAIESEAATTTLLRLAASYEDFDSPLRRLATTINEYFGCGRVTAHVAEALQCLGGNGYSEPFGMAQLLRDAAVHPIWEGSGNVIALDLLRAMATAPEAVEAFMAECEIASGANADLDAHLVRTKNRLVALLRAEEPQLHARRMAEDMALAFSASLLVRHSIPAVADAYCAGRLGADRGLAYGTLPAGVDCAAILERALPA